MRNSPLQCDINMNCVCYGSLTYSADEVVCDACRPGFYTLRVSSRTNPIVNCLPCEEGYFTDRLGSSSCKPQTTCTAGTAEKVAATSSSDRTCVECEAGVTFTTQVWWLWVVWCDCHSLPKGQRAVLSSSDRV